MQQLTPFESAVAPGLLEEANAPSVDSIGSQILLATGSFAFSPMLAAYGTLLAAAIGLLIPLPAIAMIMIEGGPIESATCVIYVVAIAALWRDSRPEEARTTRIALSVLLAGFLGRELDLHKSADGVSLLKLSSYADLSGATAKLAVVGAALATMTAAFYLVRRYGLALVRRLRMRDPLASTVLSFLVLLVLSKIADRLPVLLAEYTGIVLLPAMRHGVLAFEEIAELMLPVLVLVGVIQYPKAGQQAVSGPTNAPDGDLAPATLR